MVGHVMKTFFLIGIASVLQAYCKRIDSLCLKPTENTGADQRMPKLSCNDDGTYGSDGNATFKTSL